MKVVKPAVNSESPTIIIVSNTQPETMFPKRRNERDTIFASRPIISKNQRKRDTMISKAFTKGKSI